MLVRVVGSALLFAVMARPMPARAEAPLVQIALQPAYTDVAMVDRVMKSHVLDKDVIDFLHSEGPALDVKVAVINSLGVSFDAAQLRADGYARAVHGKEAKALDKKALRGDELLVVGHLLLLDDTLTTTKALPFLEAAQRKLPESFTVAFVTVLGRQVNTSSPAGWCGLWRSSERVLRDPKLVTDMREGGIDLAFDYLVNFRESCPGARLHRRGARGSCVRLPGGATPCRAGSVQRRHAPPDAGPTARGDRTFLVFAAQRVVRERQLGRDRGVDRYPRGASP